MESATTTTRSAATTAQSTESVVVVASEGTMVDVEEFKRVEREKMRANMRGSDDGVPFLEDDGAGDLPYQDPHAPFDHRRHMLREMKRLGLMPEDAPAEVREHAAAHVETDEHEAATQPRRFPLAEAHVAYGDQVKAAVFGAFPTPTGAERVLLDLLVREAPLVSALNDARVQVIARMPFIIDNVEHVALLAKAMRDLTTVTHAVGRRMETLLATLTSLRAQRRLLEQQESK